MNDPFATKGLSEATRRAADNLMRDLKTDPRFAHCGFFEPGGGKMFGVLIARDASGRVHTLRAFSGALPGVARDSAGSDGGWLLEGFAPPAYDLDEREAFWPAGQSELAHYEQQERALEGHPEHLAARAALAKLRARHAEERHVWSLQRQANKLARKALRDATGTLATTEQQQNWQRESQFDRAETKRLLARQAAEAEPIQERLAGWQQQLWELRDHRVQRSRALWERLHVGYRFRNARGERATLASLFDGAPPTGAGDCAAPKLLCWAVARGLVPFGLAEFWWGAPPLGGGRQSGVFYPACRGKCGPILPFLLRGALQGDELPSREPLYDPQPGLPAILWEDEHVVAVDKPAGLLTVPGRGADKRDSIETRLQAHYGGYVVMAHRLDQATSGVVLAARTPQALVRLHEQFAQRTVRKLYRAVLKGQLTEDEGFVDLPLRLDANDRPRQVVDRRRGKSAQTEWKVVGRGAETIHIEFRPLTGRTHQLRVHAAHPDGLDCPIVGDSLYGFGGSRLHLHATRLEIAHPATGETLVVVSEVPWTVDMALLGTPRGVGAGDGRG